MRSKLSEAAAAMGRAGKGKAKVRGNQEFYRALGASRWAGMSAEERSLEMSRRRQLGMKRPKKEQSMGDSVTKKALARFERAVNKVKGLEWDWNDAGVLRCVICAARKDSGSHVPGCELAKVLANETMSDEASRRRKLGLKRKKKGKP